MPKPKKVYKQGSELIVCHRGAHYLAPTNTRVRGNDRVPVLVGEEPDTVVVLGETWTLKGSYTKGGGSKPTRAPKKRSKPRKAVAIRPTLQPLEAALELIQETAPNSGAACLMRTMYENWCNGLSHLKLFAGLNYEDATVTRQVHELGRQIMREHGVNP